MRFPRASFLLVLAACSSSEPTDDEIALEKAQEIRRLDFLTPPSVERRSRESYIAAEAAVGAALTDADVADLHAVEGRLGFFPPSFDVRSVFRTSATQRGAFYSPRDKKITLFDELPEPHIFVHELVHALQDQYFDLLTYDEGGSSDEHLARRAVVEGDARLCEWHFEYGKLGHDPLWKLQREMTPALALEESKNVLETSGLPPYFVAYRSFAYPFGGGMLARGVGIHEGIPRWNRAGADALFGASAPRSSEEVLRRAHGFSLDEIAEVGLTQLPPALADRYDVIRVDRIGAWYTSLLFGGFTGPEDLALSWDGDQLVVLAERSTSILPKHPTPVAVVWTSIWETEVRTYDFLFRMASAAGVPSSPNPTDVRGESTVLTSRGLKAVFVKGAIPPEHARILAEAALDERDARRPLLIQGTKPIAPPLE